jgi:hypothetical protein
VAQPRFLAHNPQHALVVDIVMLAVHLGRHAPIAVASKRQHNALNRIAERNIALGLSGRVAPLVQPGSAGTEQRTELASR